MRVAIVGAGFSGIGMGAELQRAGHTYTIFERADDLGGVWEHNTYPGAACDVPSYLYSYSWAQRHDWSQPCSPQQEIKEYLRDVARRTGVLKQTRFGTEVTEARWDPGALKWRLRLGAGEREAGEHEADEYEADVLILACGQLTRPAFPSIPGAETFAGHAFHSAQWDHGHDLTGERVAVIGTGASAIQFVPEIAEQVRRLDVYQRTAPYVLPRRNRPYPEPMRELIRRVPGLQSLRRYGMWGLMEWMIFAYTKSPAAKRLLESWSTAYMRLALLGDGDLRRRVWPDYPFGCKRILFSSYYLKALRRRNVELFTDKIDRITADGVVTADGVERPVDTIIWSTGFHADAFVVPMDVFGADGVELQQTWRAGAEAHLGITVAGYPNMFLLYGPNTNLGVGSIIVMLEGQIGYVNDALALIGEGSALEVRSEVMRRSTAAVQERLNGSIWTECHSWYRQNGDGRIVGNWPGFMVEYLRDVRRVERDEYRLLTSDAG